MAQLPAVGTYRNSDIGRSCEPANLCGTFVALCLPLVADAIEDKDYHYTWVERENAAMETSK